MADSNETPSTPTKSTEGNIPVSSKAELIKVTLEFISKCFYPAIIVVVIVLLLPAFRQVDFKGLVGRLKSAKAGEYEFTFTQAQDVGAETAPLNNKVAELERLLVSIQSDVSRLQSRVVQAQVSEAEKNRRLKEERIFQENSKYTVLVFHRRTSREKGRTVTSVLLKSGFKSSGTETDFSELKKVEPKTGVVFVTYNSAGEIILPKIKKLLEGLIPGTRIRVNPRAIGLRRGDVQVLVF